MAALMLWPSGLERGADELLEYKRRAVRLITRGLHVARCTDGTATDSELASPNFLICCDDLHVKMLMTPSLDIDAYQRERGTPMLDKSVPAYDNLDWRASAERQELNCIDHN